MDSKEQINVSFPFDWTVKSTTYYIKYRKAFDSNEIDEIFCSIINAKGDSVNKNEFGKLLGFNLVDLAESDILDIYLNSLKEYNLIEFDEEIIKLTDFGLEALNNKLKYKYFFANAEFLENQTATVDKINFSFKESFNLENEITLFNNNEQTILFDNPVILQKLQFQLFENDIYKGDIIELLENNTKINFRNITLQCEINSINNSLEINILKEGLRRPNLIDEINNFQNVELKNKLIHKGKFLYTLENNISITSQDVEKYIDLWNWKDLAMNQKVDWKDKEIFELFKNNGDGSIWNIISENAPIESIKALIREYEDFWNWSVLTERIDNNFIQEEIYNFNWDFEELSNKDIDVVTSLLLNQSLKNRDWNWNYLSKNLSNEFIENHIDNFPWDFYEVTTSKNDVFKNIFNKYSDKLELLIVKPWNWKYISEKIHINFLYKNISVLAEKIDWHIVLNRFFNDKEQIEKCIEDENFKSILAKNLPDNYIISHQNYLWSIQLTYFLDELRLIQWQTTSYINGFDTNEYIKWDKYIFQSFHNKITAEKGYLNVSQRITDYSLLEKYPDFKWDWEGISQNKILINNLPFLESALSGMFSFSNELNWNEIFTQTTVEIDFFNKYLEIFHLSTDSKNHIEFWEQLTRLEEQEFILDNYHFPWDWSYVTENCIDEIILDSFDNEELIGKWDWEIATKKLDKETILEYLEDFTHYIDWKFLINNVFSIENELSFENELPRIAACLTVFGEENKKVIWKELTAIFPFETLFNYIKKTINLDVFEWDWDLISNHQHLPTDIRTLSIYKNKLNWTILTQNEAIKQKFNPHNWDSFRECFDNTDNYLNAFEKFWNWEVLSQNGNINYNRNILKKFRDKNWDWNYLSESGEFIRKQKKDSDNYLFKLLSTFPNIQFNHLSKRKDIFIDKDLIVSYKNKNWDWKILSENEKAEISIELLIELKDKDWDWESLTYRKSLNIDNQTLLQLFNKNWDWLHLSENKNIVFDYEFLYQTISKPWNWEKVSTHKTFSPTYEILNLTKDYNLDWLHLSKHPKLNPSRELLAKFETKWDWNSITANSQINFNDVDFIERYTDRWDWNLICKSGKLMLNNEILSRFKNYLKWDLISSNTNLDFSKEIIQEFKDNWNWAILKSNKRVEELLGDYVTEEISKSATLTFIDKIEQQYSQWKGSIYHFTHIDNAVQIIKSRKIQSRNNADIKGDAAGNVVHLRNDAHAYARFYFRPQTPTQFYNEFLGKNISSGYMSKHNGWVSWYDKARGLGYPKCPVPIFFRFSLKEVLYNNESSCCISNGNMQTSSTKFGSVDKMIGKFGFDDLYYFPHQYATKEDYNRYRNFAQQEFLVKDELSFNELSEIEIVCHSFEDRELLIKLIGQENNDLFTKIIVDQSYYNNENPRIKVQEEDSELHISTQFKGDGYFVLSSSKNLSNLKILSGDVNKIDKDKIIFNSYISLGDVTQNIDLNFIDESNRNWFVYTTN